MGKIGFKAIAWLVAIGVVFMLGFVAGGSFGSGMAVDKLEGCLPAQTTEELQPCATGDQP